MGGANKKENMKALNKFFIAVFAIFSIVSTVSAQTPEETEAMIQKRAAEKVAQMNDYIAFMANKQKSVENRRYYKNKALNLFVGKGFSYEENGVEKDGVMMEITSVNRKSVSHKLMRTYFENLINLNYSNVKIESTEIAKIKVSNLQQVEENLYVCTCQYDQAFVGMRDGRVVYKDITTKRIKCYVTVEDTEDGKEYIIMLGDVTALDTKRM